MDRAEEISPLLSRVIEETEAATRAGTATRVEPRFKREVQPEEEPQKPRRKKRVTIAIVATTLVVLFVVGWMIAADRPPEQIVREVPQESFESHVAEASQRQRTRMGKFSEWELKSKEPKNGFYAFIDRAFGLIQGIAN